MRARLISGAIVALATASLPVSATAQSIGQDSAVFQPYKPATNREYNPCYPDGDCSNRGRRAPPPKLPETPAKCNLGCALFIAAIIIILTAVVVHLTGKKLASTDELDQDGPRFPNNQGVGQFEVQGYVRSGWPIVVDYQSDPDTRTWIDIESGRGEKTTIELPARSERSVEVVQFNPQTWSAGDETVPARYSVHAADRVGSTKAVEHAPLTVYGIGAGPRAVGSMTLFITRFDPAEAARRDNVGFTLKSLRLYDRSVVEMLKLPKPGEKNLQLVGSKKLFPLVKGNVDGNWATMLPGNSSATVGYYALQSRAWLVGSNHDERDWTGAFAPNYVHVQ